MNESTMIAVAWVVGVPVGYALGWAITKAYREIRYFVEGDNIQRELERWYAQNPQDAAAAINMLGDVARSAGIECEEFGSALREMVEACKMNCQGCDYLCWGEE